MGIRLLKTLIEKNQTIHSVSTIHLSNLSGKRIAIDASVYMYKWNVDNKLIENIQRAVDLFKQRQVTPIFIFDGLPTDDKLATIQKRRDERRAAKQLYKEMVQSGAIDSLSASGVPNNAASSLTPLLLQHQTSSISQEGIITVPSVQLSTCTELCNTVCPQTSNTMTLQELATLKQTMSTLSANHFKEVKEIMDKNEIEYMCANGEADELCVYLMRKNKVWGCMSDDTDMFVYGCERVLRDFQISDETCILYTLTSVLHSLNMSMNEFREVCVLSGTDYHPTYKIGTHNLFKIYAFFMQWKSQYRQATFYAWLQYTKKIQNLQEDKLREIIDKFTQPINGYDDNNNE